MQMSKQTTVIVHPPPAIRQRDIFTEAQHFQGGFGLTARGWDLKFFRPSGNFGAWIPTNRIRYDTKLPLPMARLSFTV